MIENSMLDNLIDKSMLIQAIKNRDLNMEAIVKYLESRQANTFEEQINEMFNLLYNSFGTSEVTADEDYVLQVLGSIPTFIMAAQAIPSMETGDELTEEQIEQMQEQLAEYSLKEQMIRVYAKFVVFINGALNDSLMLLSDKVEQLLEIDRNILPDCEAKKLYLYYLLNILLAQPIENVELIQEITEELRQYVIE